MKFCSAGREVVLTRKGCKKVVPCALTEHYAMKAYWESECMIHAFLTPAQDGGEWSAPHPGRLTPEEGDPITHWRGNLWAPTGNRTHSSSP